MQDSEPAGREGTAGRSFEGYRPQRIRLWHLPPGQLLPLLARATRQAARDRITTGAGSLAFHAFLALVPVLVASVAALDLIGLPGHAVHSLVHAIGVLLPTQMATVIGNQLVRPPSRQVNIVEVTLGLLVALWSSIEAMASLQVALDVAYEVPRDRGLLGRRLVALPLVLVTLVLGGVASVLLVLGREIDRLVPSGVGPALLAARDAVSLVLVVLLLSAFYSIGPARDRLEWEWISPGAVLAAAGWLLAALGFSFYLDRFGHESRTYGALAGVAVTLLWLYLTAGLVLFGAEVNRELERVAEAAKAAPR